MDSSQLTLDQAAKIHSELMEASRYLSRLQTRMIEIGFPLDDALLPKVIVARQAMHALVDDLHRRAYRNTGYGKQR